MTQIKICGITNLDDALAAVDAGAHMLGFVFAESPRRIDPIDACRIIKGLPKSATPVAVFMNQPEREIERVAKITGVRTIQMHGNEPPGTCDDLSVKVIRRIPVRAGDTSADLIARMDRYRDEIFLLDPGAGNGQIFRWQIAQGISRRFFLAGGLSPENVGEAIRVVRPYGVDVSSSVEMAVGRKSRERLAAFIRAVRCCDAQIDA